MRQLLNLLRHLLGLSRRPPVILNRKRNILILIQSLHSFKVNFCCCSAVSFYFNILYKHKDKL